MSEGEGNVKVRIEEGSDKPCFASTSSEHQLRQEAPSSDGGKHEVRATEGENEQLLLTLGVWDCGSVLTFEDSQDEARVRGLGTLRERSNWLRVDSNAPKERRSVLKDQREIERCRR